MKCIRLLLPLGIIFIICSIFFYNIFTGEIPFPGDLLVGHYAPYNTQTYSSFSPGTVPHKAQGPDVIKELYPWKHFVIEQLKNFQIPFWDPYNFSGNPLMANFQSGTFYFLNLVFFIFPFHIGWTVFIFLTPILAAWFLYLFLRTIKLDMISSIFGGIVFAFSSYMVVWMEYGNIGHTMLYLPLSLYALERFLQQSKKKFVILFILSNWLAFNAGYIQGYFYSSAVLLFYFFMKEYLAKKLSVKKIVFFLLFLLTPVLLSLYQLLPTLELFKFSSRGAYSLSQIQHLLNPWWYTITTVVPDFFGNPASRNNWIDRTYIEGVSYFGVIPLFLALGALLNGKKPKEIIIFGVVFVVSYLLSVDVFITRYIYLLPIPVLTTTVPTRILSLFVFSGSILSAFGLQFMLKEKLSKTWLVVILFLGGVLGICWGIAILTPELLHGINNIDSASVVKRNLFLPTTAWVLMTGYTLIKLGANSSHYIIRMISRAQKIYRYKIDSTFLMLFFTLFELFYFFHKITPFSPAEYIYPKTPVISYLQKNAGINRFWGYGSGYIESNFQTYDKTFSPEGNDPLHILSYTELVSSTGNGSVPAILPRPDAKIQPGFAKEDLGNNIYRKKVLDILGIKYLLEKNEAISDNTTKQSDFDTFPESEYSIVWQDTPWQVYENKNAVTRAIVTSDFVVISDKKNLLQKIYNVSFDPKKTILLSEDPGIMQSDNVGTVQINSYSPNKVVMHTKSSADSLLFLSDTYYPSWHVTVDGKEAKVLKADYAFRANAVPKGEHEVIYYYDDKKFLYGFYLSLLTLMILSVGLWKGKIQSI